MSAAISGQACAEGVRRHLHGVDSPEPDVQIWIAHLDSLDASDIEKMSVSLDLAESRRAAEFRFAQDRQRYCAAHGLLRHVLGGMLGQEPRDIVFQHETHGKPKIVQQTKDTRKLHFNISHSKEWALFAVSWEREVGIDLEAEGLLPGHSELIDLALRVFSRPEFEKWQSLINEEARRTAILRAWVRKEACIKASGEGLHLELSQIELSAGPRRSHLGSIQKKQRWTVHDLIVPAALAAAIAV